MDNWEQNLPPRVRQRLAKIGELTSVEKERLRHSQGIGSLLAEYFRNDLSLEALWHRLKELRDEGEDFVLADAQNKLIDTIRLELNETELEKRRSAVLAIETLKHDGSYSILEQAFQSIGNLQHEYLSVKDQTYKQLRSAVEKQLDAVVQQALMKGLKVDVASSIDASVKSDARWQAFIRDHNKNYVARLEMDRVSLKRAVSIFGSATL